MKSRLDEKDRRLSEEAAAAEENFSRLKCKLDEKDELIGKQREQLARREERIEKLEAETERLKNHQWKDLKDSGLPPELLTGLKALL